MRLSFEIRPYPNSGYTKILFLIQIEFHSMQGLAVTARHGITKKTRKGRKGYWKAVYKELREKKGTF